MVDVRLGVGGKWTWGEYMRVEHDAKGNALVDGERMGPGRSVASLRPPFRPPFRAGRAVMIDFVR